MLTEYTCKHAEVVRAEPRSYDNGKSPGWYVDAITVCGKRLRYTVLGCTPYPIADEAEAREFAAECAGETIDNGAWTEMS